MFDTLLQLEETLSFLKSIVVGEDVDEYYLKKNIRKCEECYNGIQAEKDKIDENTKTTRSKILLRGNQVKTAYDTICNNHNQFREIYSNYYSLLLKHDGFRLNAHKNIKKY